MSDETRPVSLTPIEARPLPAQGIDDHWCMHEGCKRWGSFGYDRRFGTHWFCGDHRSDNEVR